MRSYEIAALMQRDESGKPYWLRRCEEEKAKEVPNYERDFEDRHGFAPAEIETTASGEDADYAALYRARFGMEATS